MVGLVEHGDLDGVQVQVALSAQVFEAAGAGDEDLHTGIQGVHLATLADAAEDDGGAQTCSLGQRGQGGADLAGELAGGGEHQAERPASLRAPAGEVGDHRQAESQGLPGTGAAAAEHISTGEGVRERGGLDRERGVDAARGERVHQVGGHTQLEETRGS